MCAHKIVPELERQLLDGCRVRPSRSLERPSAAQHVSAEGMNKYSAVPVCNEYLMCLVYDDTARRGEERRARLTAAL